MSSRECKVHKLVADVIVLAQGRVLFVRYNEVSKYDGQEGWFLPDDFLIYGEHPRDAAKRILQEQVGLDPDDITLSYIESFGGEEGGVWHLIFHHKVELEQMPRITPLVNVKAAEWFPLEDLPERSFVAHEGWAIDVIGEALKPVGITAYREFRDVRNKRAAAFPNFEGDRKTRRQAIAARR